MIRSLYRILIFTGLVLAAVSIVGCDTGSAGEESELPGGTLLFVARDTTVTANNGWRSLLVYKADLRTGQMVALTSPDESGADRGPAFEAIWSPDGRRIVYHEAIGIDAGHLTIMNADGTGKRTLSDPWEHRALPMWGPDERTAFYEQRVYAGIPVGLFALDIKTAPASNPFCVLCNPDGPFGAEPFVTSGDTLSAVAVAAGPDPGTVVLVSPVSRPPAVGDYDAHLYLVDYRNRKVLQRLTTRPLRGHRFAVSRGGRAVLMMRLEAAPSQPGSMPSALYVAPVLGQEPIRVARFDHGGFAGFRWASDGRHAVIRREVLDGQAYATGDYTVDVLDALDPAPVLIPLRWVPPTLGAVPDLFIP